jgi:uncharacterized protein (TIGR02452 family)
VDIGESLLRAVDGVEFVDQDHNFMGRAPSVGGVEIFNLSSADAALVIKERTPLASVLVLNFASARNPGGGFIGGAQAQEESLARQSGLYATIESHGEFYGPHTKNKTPLYSDRMLYSPQVPFFRDGDDELLEKPILVDILTVAAPNAGTARTQGMEETKIHRAMEQRVEKIISLIATKNLDYAVLGAFGCGVFGNDAEGTARIFRKAIAERGGATNYVFAIPGGDNLETFRRILDS